MAAIKASTGLDGNFRNQTAGCSSGSWLGMPVPRLLTASVSVLVPHGPASQSATSQPSSVLFLARIWALEGDCN